MLRRLLSGSCVLFGLTFAANAVDLSEFAKRVVITASDSAALPAGRIVHDCPVLVRLSESIAGFSWNDFAKADFSDLVLTDRFGNELPYDVDTRDESGHPVLLWVRVPSLSRGTVLCAYYGSQTGVPTLASTATWKGYAGVWHMNEASGNALDSTENGLDAVATGGNVEEMISVPGLVGGGRVVSSGSANAFIAPYHAALDVAPTFTLSMCVKVDTHLNYARLFSHGECFETEIEDKDTVIAVRGANGYFIPTIPDLQERYRLMTFVYNLNGVDVYADGVFVTHGDITPATNMIDTAFALGGDLGRGRPLYGRLDEARLVKDVLSPVRIALDYALLTEADFFSYAVEDVPVSASDEIAGYSHVLVLTVSDQLAPKSGAQLADFPVLVRLRDGVGGFDASAATRATGNDLLFTDLEGGVLPHEVDSWDPTGESLVWVKLPVLKRGVRFLLRYGATGSGVVRAPGGSVWSAYVAVWHMNDGVGSAYDSTGNGFTALPVCGRNSKRYNPPPTGFVTGPMLDVDGHIGNAVKLSSSDNADPVVAPRNRFEAPSYDAFVADSSRFTFSGWYKMNQPLNCRYPRLVGRKAVENGGDGWEIWLNYGSTIIGPAGSGEDGETFEVEDLAASWRYLQFAYDGPIVRSYADGVQCRTVSVTPVVANGLPLALGSMSTGDDDIAYGLPASLDELRFKAETASGDWAAAEYLSQSLAEPLEMSPYVPAVCKEDFAKRIRFTVQGTEALAGGSVVDMPVLVRLSTALEGFSYADFGLPRGRDMIFVDAAGTVIPHEIDTWNPAGESLVWVKVPLVQTGAKFTMYFGNGVDPTETLSAGNPWGGYRGVWHAGEADGAVLDATTNRLDATPTPFSAGSISCMTGVPGVVGLARYNTDNEEHRQGLVISSSSALDMGGTFTVSGWFRSHEKIAYWPRILSRRQDSSGWEVELDRDNSGYDCAMAAWADSVAVGTSAFDGICGNWAYLAFVYSPTTVSCYLNGVCMATGSVSAPVSDATNCDLVFGCNVSGNTQAFAGVMDELRLAPVAFDAVRVRAEYATVTDSAFLRASAAKPAKPDGLLLLVR